MTVISTVDPAAASSSAAASQASVAAAKASAAASASSASAAAGPIYYSMICKVGGDFKEFATYQDAWKASPVPSSCDASAGGRGVKHGQQLTETQSKALNVAYGADADKDSLAGLFGICGGVDGFYTTKIINLDQANEAAGALLICPDHPNAAKIQANIDSVKNLTAEDPTANVSDIITYEITGSAASALVTYSQQGGSIGQENDVPVPWTKTLTITGEYRSLAVSAQNSGDGDITCSIKVGDKVVNTVTSKGAYAIASCFSS